MDNQTFCGKITVKNHKKPAKNRILSTNIRSFYKTAKVIHFIHRYTAIDKCILRIKKGARRAPFTVYKND